MRLELADAPDTEAFGARLADASERGALIFLHGELGAGKTTLVRGFLRQLGYQGPVRSPTYTLIEPYELSGRAIYHMDLYRMADPEELEYVGVRDYLGEEGICLVEWPERAEELLRAPDLSLYLQHQAQGGRTAHIMALSARGERILLRLESDPSL